MTVKRNDRALQRPGNGRSALRLTRPSHPLPPPGTRGQLRAPSAVSPLPWAPLLGAPPSRHTAEEPAAQPLSSGSWGQTARDRPGTCVPSARRRESSGWAHGLPLRPWEPFSRALRKPTPLKQPCRTRTEDPARCLPRPGLPSPHRHAHSSAHLSPHRAAAECPPGSQATEPLHHPADPAAPQPSSPRPGPRQGRLLCVRRAFPCYDFLQMPAHSV